MSIVSVCMAGVAVFLFAGCSAAAGEPVIGGRAQIIVQRKSNAEVVQVVQLNFDRTVAHKTARLKITNFIMGEEFGDITEGMDYIRVVMDTDLKTTREIERTAFFISRTTYIENPFTDFLTAETNKAAILVNMFLNMVECETRDVGMVFVYTTPQRSHYFTGAELSNITLRDRYANTPMWYGLAVLMTAVFMTTVYFVSRHLHITRK